MWHYIDITYIHLVAEYRIKGMIHLQNSIVVYRYVLIEQDHLR